MYAIWVGAEMEKEMDCVFCMNKRMFRIYSECKLFVVAEALRKTDVICMLLPIKLLLTSLSHISLYAHDIRLWPAMANIPSFLFLILFLWLMSFFRFLRNTAPTRCQRFAQNLLGNWAKKGIRVCVNRDAFKMNL